MLRSIIVRRSFVAPLLLASLAGCASEYKFTPTDEAQFVEPGQALCLPMPVDSDTGAGSGRLGASVALLSWGSLASGPTARASTAAGAPAANSGAGRVRINEARSDTSALDAFAPLNPPAGAFKKFGAALLAADVVDLFLVDQAIGQELLVGAPGVDQDAGEIFWYYASPSFAGNSPWSLGGSYQPANLTSGANFGAAIAAARPSAAHPAWIAVGAPGAGQVYVVPITPSGASPFPAGPALQITSASAGFGAAVISGDFDGDGVPDLAVGAPSGTAGGEVHVFRGLTASPPTFTPPLVLRLGAGADELGAALDAGRFFGSAPTQDGLLVGAPGWDTASADVGGACQYLLAPTTSSGPGFSVVRSGCFFNVAGAANDRMGHAVAVGNFNPADQTGGMSSLFAQTAEVVVGVPGSAGGVGEALVWPTDLYGISGTTPLTTLHMIGGSAGELFGASIAHGYAFDPMYHPTEDLVIGAPQLASGTGGFVLTKGAATGPSSCHSTSGTWQGLDSRSVSVTVTIGDPCGTSLDLTLDNNMVFKVVDSTGALCSVAGETLKRTLDAGSLLTVASWNGTTGQISVSTGSIAGDVVIDVRRVGATLVLALDTTTGAGSLMPTGCTVENGPFVLTEVTATVCD